MEDVKNLKISIDCDECIGDGACVSAAPETFDLDDDAKAFVRDAVGDDRESILAAAEDCPLDIITVVDASSGEKLYPTD